MTESKPTGSAAQHATITALQRAVRCLRETSAFILMGLTGGLALAQTATTTMLTVTPSAIYQGQSATVNVTVTGSSPTGTVTIREGTTSRVSLNLSSAAASTSITFNTLGERSLTAVYSGNSGNASSTSAPVILTVNPKEPTTVNLAANQTTVYVGQSVTFTATVSGTIPTGTVSLMRGSTTLNWINLNANANGAVNLSAPFSTAGSQDITAVYSGNSVYAASTSNTVTVVANPKLTTTTTMSADPSPSTVAQTVTLTANVSGGSNPTGTVSFRNGSSGLTSATVNASGVATTTVTRSAVETLNLTAVYNGDTANATSTSAAVVHTVNPLSTTTQMVCPANTPVATSINCTIDVSIPLYINLSGQVVSIVENGSAVGSGTLSYISSPGNYRATVTLAATSTPIATAGAHSLIASMPATDRTTASTSAPVALTVAQRSTSTSISASPTTAGATQVIILTASVTNGLSPTGTVTFRDGSTTLGTTSLSGTQAVATTSFSTTGAHSLTATYDGDTNNTSSTSATVTETITPTSPTTTTLVLSPASVTAGSNTTLLATIAGSSPGGTVVFSEGNTTLGSATMANGQASLVRPFGSVGSHALVASYWGDTVNASSTSAAATLTVTQRPTTNTLTSALSKANQAQAIPLTATINGANPTGTVTFKEGSTTLGTAPVANGSAVFNASFTVLGAHAITSSYAGDTNNLASDSGSVTVQIQPGPMPPASTPPVVNYEYDAQGNPTKAIVAPGVSGFNLTTQASYDALSRIKDTTDPKLGKTQFLYDGLDRTLRVTDPRNLATQYPRNGLGDATQLISPDTGTAAHTYDEAGNLTTRTDSRGVLATHSYDALNRLTQSVFSKSGMTSQTFGWVYDQSGAGFAYGSGRLTSTTHPAGSTQYSYDAQGRLVTDTQVVSAAAGANGNPVSSTMSYGYDAAGHLTSLVYPSGRQLVVTYTDGQPSALGLAKDTGSTPVNLITGLAFEPFGGVSTWQWQLATGTQSNDKVYDTSGRLVRYRLGGLLRDLAYDAGSRIASYTHYDANTGAAQASLDQGFGYDANGQLTGITTATASWTISYDANGNRTGVTLNGTPSTYTTEATSNKLTSITNPARSFGYDSAGNTTSDSGGYSATYDASGRLATITKAGMTTTYAYNGQGQRVRKFSSTGVASTVIFVMDQQGHLLGEYDSTGKALREYVWLGSTPIAMFTPDTVATNPPVVYYFHTDHLNTPRVVTDTAGNIRWRWLAEPFGTTAPETNPSGLGVFTQPLRFPGQYADAESGLSDNWHRTYDSTIGRYNTSDPIGLAGGSMSPFAYVDGNPLSYTDPKGLFVPLVIVGVCAAGGCEAAGAVLAAGAIWWATQHPVVMPVAMPSEPMYAKPPRVNDPQAQADHDDYKNRYNEPPPPFKDPCDELRWKLKREEDLLRSRRAWDAKWLPGRHAGMSGEVQSENAIKKLKEKMKNQGCDCP